jgi:porphobilinogen synthase
VNIYVKASENLREYLKEAWNERLLSRKLFVRSKRFVLKMIVMQIRFRPIFYLNDGIIENGDVENDSTNEAFSKMARFTCV